jgi:hypothetical protein
MEKVHAYWIISASGDDSEIESLLNAVRKEVIEKFGVAGAIHHFENTRTWLGCWDFGPLERVLEVKPYFDKVVIGTADPSIYEVQIDVTILDVTSNTPLLRYLRYPLLLGPSSYVLPDRIKMLNDIFAKYRTNKPLKQRMWQCQQELIDNGFEGNARF